MSIKRNQYIDMLRGVWMIFVFMSHWNPSYLCKEVIFRGGSIGVTGFFMLSGFLIFDKYSDDFENYTIKKLVLFCKKRIGKLYVLHILCMVPTFIEELPIAISLFLQGNTAWENYVIDYGLNFLLLQCLFQRRSINGVAWFLSCIFIAYVFAPMLSRITNKLLLHRGYWIISSVFILLIMHLGQYDWTYRNPLYRMFQFEIGMLLVAFKKYVTSEKYSILMLLGVFFTFAAFAGGNAQYCFSILGAGCLILGTYVHNRENVSLYFNKAKRFLARLGEVSGSFFLIHYPVGMINCLFDKATENNQIIISVVGGIIWFLLAYVLSLLYNKGYELLQNKKLGFG